MRCSFAFSIPSSLKDNPVFSSLSFSLRRTEGPIINGQCGEVLGEASG